MIEVLLAGEVCIAPPERRAIFHLGRNFCGSQLIVRPLSSIFHAGNGLGIYGRLDRTEAFQFWLGIQRRDRIIKYEIYDNDERERNRPLDKTQFFIGSIMGMIFRMTVRVVFHMHIVYHAMHMERTPLTLEKIAIKATRWIGSTQSLVAHTVVFAVSFLLVVLGIPFDRVLLVLTTVLSLEAIYLSIFIQMSVNRSEARLNAVSEDIEEIQEDVEGIEKDVDEIQKDIDEIQEDVEEIQEDVEGIEKDVEEIHEDHVHDPKEHKEQKKA